MKPTTIYFAACKAPNGSDIGAIKVGCSANVKKRAKALSAGQPYTCTILATCPGSFLEEAVLHEWLRADQISGEFFHDTAEVRRLISSTRETSRMPVRIEAGTVPLRWIDQGGTANFMAAHGLTVDEAVKLTGRHVAFFMAGLRQKVPSRRLVASLAVAALKKGHAVNWEADFLASDKFDLRKAA